MDTEKIRQHLRNIAHNLKEVDNILGPEPLSEPAHRSIALPLPEYPAGEWMRRIDNPPGDVTIHWTGVTASEKGPIDSIQKIWRHHTQRKGWADIGYHLAWDKEGERYSLRDMDKIGAHARGHNHTWGWVFIGTDVTREGLDTLRRMWADHKKQWPLASISPHSRWGNTVCPGGKLRLAIEKLAAE